MTTTTEWLRRLAIADAGLAVKARQHLSDPADPEFALSHDEYVRAIGLAGPIPGLG